METQRDVLLIFFLTSSPRRQVISIHHLDIGPLSCFLLVFQHSRKEERSEKEFFFSLFFLLLFPSFSERNDNWNSKKSVMLCGCADISVRGQWSAHFHSVEPVFFVVIFFSFSFRFFYLFLLFFQRLETSGSPNNGSVDSTNLLGSSSLLSLYIFLSSLFLDVR